MFEKRLLFLAIHAVDKIHAGKSDSSVMYIPACPLTDTNAEYLKRQRETFFKGTLLLLLKDSVFDANVVVQGRRLPTFHPVLARASIWVDLPLIL